MRVLDGRISVKKSYVITQICRQKTTWEVGEGIDKRRIERGLANGIGFGPDVLPGQSDDWESCPEWGIGRWRARGGGRSYPN